MGDRLYFLTTGQLSASERNATSSKLNAILEEIASQKEKSVLIIDELNVILENYASQNYDTKDNATTLWTNLDKNRNNPNFFFIGIGNETKKIPPQLQTRFLLKFVKITEPNKDVHIELLHQFH